MKEFCNDGRCPRTRSGEYFHPVHKIVKNPTKADLYFAFVFVAVLTAITTSFSNSLQHWTEYLDSAYLAILIGYVGLWYARTSTTELKQYVDWGRYLQHATTYFNSKEWQNARSYYDKALELTPKNIILLNNSGASLSRLKNDEEALPYYEKILEVEPENVPALNNRGSAFMSLEQYEKAEVSFVRGLEIEPEDLHTLNNMGVLYLNLEEYDYAMQYFDQVLEIDPKDVSGWFNKGKVKESQGQAKDALLFYNKALEIDPDFIKPSDPDLEYQKILQQKGNALMNLEKFEEAVACYEKALKISPLDTDNIFNLTLALAKVGKFEEANEKINEYMVTVPNKAEAFDAKALCLDGIGTKLLKEDREKATPYLREALGCINKALEISPDVTQALINKAVILGKLGNHTESLELIERCLEREPENIEFLLNKSLALTDLGRKTDAITEGYDKMLSIDPDHKIALEHKGRLLISIQEYQRAIDECINPLLNDSENDINLLDLKAGALRNSQQNIESIEVYNKILSINQHDTIAITNKGLCFMNLQQYQRAIDECFDDALSIDPNNLHALINKGASLYHLGRHEESILCYDKILSTRPRNSQAWYNKSYSLQAIGRYAEAWECFNKSEKYGRLGE